MLGLGRLIVQLLGQAVNGLELSVDFVGVLLMVYNKEEEEEEGGKIKK